MSALARTLCAVVIFLLCATTAHAQTVICPVTPDPATSNQICANTAFVHGAINATPLAPIANNNFLANTSGGTAAPVATTTSAFFDSVCSTTIGQFWVRMTGGWGCTSLSPANPVWWGADPTDTTDSAPAINSAITSLCSTGGTVHIPAGVFIIDETIQMCSGVNLTGEGPIDWALIQVTPNFGSPTELVWGGASKGTMISLGNVYTGNIGGFQLNGGNIASIGMDLGAPISCRIHDIEIDSTIPLGSGQDAQMIAYLTGQVFPNNPSVQIPSALALCKLDNISLNPPPNQSGFWGRGVTDFVATNIWAAADGFGVSAIRMQGDAAITDNDSDTISFVGGLISSINGAAGFLSGDDADADQNGGYGYQFFGTAFNNADDTSLNLDIRNTPDGNSSYCYGCFIGPFSPNIALGNGAAAGILRFYGSTFSIPLPGTLALTNGSPDTFENDGPFQLQLILTAGTPSSLQLSRQGNNFTLPTALKEIWLDPGDKLNYTISGSPTVLIVEH